MCMCKAYATPPTEYVDEKSLERALQHAGELISKNLTELARREMVNYIWKYTRGKRKIGICSSCREEFELPLHLRAAHKELMLCPECGRESVLMTEGRGHGSIYQEFYVAEWRKSAIDPQVVVMLGSQCWLDQRHEGPESAPLKIVPTNLCVYRYSGYALRFARGPSDYNYATGERGPGAWYRQKRFNQGNSYYGGGKLRAVMPNEWFCEALAGTRFERQWKLLGPWSYPSDDRTVEMANIAKWPFLEYIAKMGQAELAHRIAAGVSAKGAINHRGKTAQAILGLTGQQLAEVKQKKIALTLETLTWKRWLEKHGIHWTMARIRETEGAIIPGENWGLAEAVEKKVPTALREKAIRYALATIEKAKPKDWHVKSDLRDYWGQMVTLETDPDDVQQWLPKNLDEAHTRAATRIKYIADKALEKKIAAFKRKLGGYEFQHGALIMRPMKDAQEVVREGRILRHCVGGYVQSYAEGRTILCALRRVDDPDTPWRTVEFSAKDGKLVQCRGNQNQSPAEEQPEIDAFFRAFEAHRNKKTRRKSA